MNRGKYLSTIVLIFETSPALAYFLWLFSTLFNFFFPFNFISFLYVSSDSWPTFIHKVTFSRKQKGDYHTVNSLLGDFTFSEELVTPSPSSVLSSLSAIVTWISRWGLLASERENLMPPPRVSLLIDQSKSLSYPHWVKVPARLKFQEEHSVIYLVGDI
jgi:hypothetical protein